MPQHIVINPAGLRGALQGLDIGIGGGLDALQQFAGPGASAFDLQGAQSGAFGPQAQAQAFQDFQASPGQDFLRQQGEQGVLRNSAALGGLGGGNIQKDLSRFNQGLASTDFNNQFNRLGSLSGIGANAAGGQASLLGQGGIQASNLSQQAGRDIANSIGGTTSALSNLINQQGAGLGDIISQGGGNLANLLSGAGAGSSQTQQSLATLLANIATGSASSVAGLPGIPGIQETKGSLGSIGNLASGVGSLIALSDIRLKENIIPIKKINDLMLYAYNYIGNATRYVGYMANEVKMAHPDKVLEIDGYLHVLEPYHPVEA